MVNGRTYGKTALVLAGGGLTGGVYEVGALRAIDDLLVDRTVNDFDIYVGTSAGALVTSLLASGVSPEDMLQIFRGNHPTMPTLESRHILNLSGHELWRWASGLPRGLLGIAQGYWRAPESLNFFELIWSLAELLPAGLYDGRGLEAYVRQVLTSEGRSNTFADLKRDLFIVATDLNSGERAVFGREENADVPISVAVEASTALPPIYKPVEIGDRILVDGGLRGTASLDIAREHGADLIVCINPLVPYDNRDFGAEPFFSPRGGYLAKKGLQGILSQASRISTHAGLHYQVKQIRKHHPNIDVIVIEPRPDDCQMFYYNIMRYSVLLMLAEHGFESVTLHLAQDHARYKQILARHGIPITRRIVMDELREIEESGYDPEVVRLVLEKRSSSCNRIRGDAICELTRALAELDMELERMAAERRVPVPG